MTATRQDLAGGRFSDFSRIEAGAMTLFERLRAWQRQDISCASSSGCAAAQALVDRWCSVVAGGDKERFAVRLGWDGLDEQGVVDAFSWILRDPEAVASCGPNRGWFECLQSDFHVGRTLIDDPVASVFFRWAEDLAIPFVELWAPWVAEATVHVSRHEAVEEGSILPSALECVNRQLLLELGELGAEAAFVQFNRRRSVELSALDDRSGDQLYRRWIREQLDDGLLALFDEFPVLAKQMFRLVETWKETTSELFGRLQSDRQALSILLTETGGLGPLKSIRPGLSDRHYGGRRVAVLEFEGGQKIVYKPRPLAIEAAFGDFLAWFETEGLQAVPQSPELLLRKSYGWMEFIDAPEFEDVEQVSRWFKCAGVLLCLTHLLGGSDLHADNVMPGRVSPVLVDLETLLHPEITVERDSGAATKTAVDLVFDSVRSSFLATGMLTFLQEGPDGHVIDIGGLCGTGGHALGIDTVKWRQLGEDGLHKVTQLDRAKEWCNVPKINGKVQTADTFAAELENGFAMAYRLIMKNRNFLRGPQGVSQWFAGLQSRVLLRPTDVYARVFQLSIQPAYQRDGVHTGIFIEGLYRQLLEKEARPKGWGLSLLERHAIEGLDIPHFTAPVDAVTLEGPEASAIEGMISASGLALFEKRLDGLSEEDLEQQIRLMALSLEAQGGETKHTVAVPSQGELLLDSVRSQQLSQNTLADVAHSIADELSKRAVAGADRSLIWLDPVHIRPEGRLDRGASYYLYSGSAGIALFFAAMSKVFPNRSYRETAEGALLPILTVLNDSQMEMRLANEGLGACHGLGGIVYALTLSSVLLNQPEYRQLAWQVANYITPERIAADQTLDVEGGSAGAILGLLALQETCPDDRILDRAMNCARHLVALQQLGPEAGAAWPSRQGGMLAGFAHGASGIALALVRLSRWVQDPSLHDAARKAIEFENSLFDPAKKNWPLVVHDSASGRSESIYMSAWCHGAPGIALARSGMRDLMPQAEAGDMLNAALETTLKTALDGPDHLCCGTLGKLDILFSTGQLLERDQLQRAAEVRVSMVIHRASTNGSFLLEEGRGPAKNGLFRGLAGIGYQMVRLYRPDEVPSVLAFQPAQISHYSRQASQFPSRGA